MEDLKKLTQRVFAPAAGKPQTPPSTSNRKNLNENQTNNHANSQVKGTHHHQGGAKIGEYDTESEESDSDDDHLRDDIEDKHATSFSLGGISTQNSSRSGNSNEDQVTTSGTLQRRPRQAPPKKESTADSVFQSLVSRFSKMLNKNNKNEVEPSTKGTASKRTKEDKEESKAETPQQPVHQESFEEQMRRIRETKEVIFKREEDDEDEKRPNAQKKEGA